jgi:uronate dehydrogenase
VSDTTQTTVFVTGAAGYLGNVLRAQLKGAYRLRLTDCNTLPTPLTAGEEYYRLDLENPAALEEAMRGADAVVHLGGASAEAPWEVVLPSNIMGTYNVFECARRCGARRVVFASTHHVVGFYRRNRRIGTDVPVRPDSRYAVSKVFGEALGRLYADKHGLSVICQRIGVARPRPPHRRSLSNWLSERDFAELTRCCLAARDVHFLVVYGVSGSTQSFYDDCSASRIGYVAQDTAEMYRAEVLARQGEPEAASDAAFQGGANCAAELEGDISQID